MQPPTARARRSLLLLFALALLATDRLAGEWLDATQALGVLPAPRSWLLVAAVVLGGARLAAGSDPRASVLDALGAGLVALVTGDGLFRLAPPAASYAASPLALATQLHVLPALYLAAGTTCAVGLCFASSAQPGQLALGPGSGRAPAFAPASGRTWNQLTARTAAAALVALGLFLGVRGVNDSFDAAVLLLPALAGTVLAAAAEEALFRGTLRPLAQAAVGPRAGNGLQALLFASVHLSPELMLGAPPAVALREAARFTLWVLVGWFLGVAARDTRGLAVPVALHILVGVAIQVSLITAP